MADPVQPAPAAAPAAPAAPELPPAGPGEVALVVDGQPVVVPKGTTVLQAAERIGIVVPHYCYHPGLSVAGNCRMCLVEIEKTPKLQIGCATTATQGMIVRTTTPRVKTTRQGIMEFLLINHPLDCPICDQAGECRLQQYSAEYGTGESRFVEEKIHNEKRYAIGARVTFDGERCIKCTRCIRFCDEVSKTGELGLFERGGHAIIGAFPGRPLDNAYSGNTVDICPVGALTWRPFRFRARVWFLKDTPSVCAGCARGCNVNLATYDGRIHRITPRLNEEVNSYWMCDFGRQSHEPLYARPRLERSIGPPACCGRSRRASGRTRSPRSSPPGSRWRTSTSRRRCSAGSWVRNPWSSRRMRRGRTTTSSSGKTGRRTPGGPRSSGWGPMRRASPGYRVTSSPAACAGWWSSARIPWATAC
jgi:NADH-quinone oxidoreductase subunit G